MVTGLVTVPLDGLLGSWVLCSSVCALWSGERFKVSVLTLPLLFDEHNLARQLGGAGSL